MMLLCEAPWDFANQMGHHKGPIQRRLCTGALQSPQGHCTGTSWSLYTEGALKCPWGFIDTYSHLSFFLQIKGVLCIAPVEGASYTCDTYENSGISCNISYIGQCDHINTCFRLLWVWYTPWGSMCRIWPLTSKESIFSLIGSYWSTVSNGGLIRPN